jgi:hypothetical protein
VWLNRVGGETVVDRGTTDGVDLLANADRAVCPGAQAQSMTVAAQAQEAFLFEQATLASYQLDAASCADTCPSGVCVETRTLECCTIPCASDFECMTGYCNDSVCDFPREGLPAAEGPHAVDFAPVLSRIRRGVFVVGGDDTTSGEPTGEIWFAPLNAGGWIPIPAAIPPDRVLAATYSWKTRSLYFLDETTPPGGELEARLVAIDVDTAQATLLGSWPRSPSWDAHHLVLDRDGALLLSSSNWLTGEHAVARIDIEAIGGPTVDGIDAGSYPLAFAPTVDGVGYTLVLAVDAPAGIVHRVRKAELDLAGGGALSSLGGQL